MTLNMYVLNVLKAFEDNKLYQCIYVEYSRTQWNKFSYMNMDSYYFTTWLIFHCNKKHMERMNISNDKYVIVFQIKYFNLFIY